MPTIPTHQMETELRKLYLRWISGLSVDSDNISGKIDDFRKRSEKIIREMGGKTARLGALGDFPVPKYLELSPYAGKVYDQMQQAAIQAGIMTGISSKETARVMFRAGMDKSYRRLERLARTETTNAYWKNAFDSVAGLPALVMVWGSEDGPRTCAWCRERDGLVMDSPSLRDHPNGRCTPVPTLRSAVDYKGSIDGNGRIYQDPAWNKAKTSSSNTAADAADQYRDYAAQAAADAANGIDPDELAWLSQPGRESSLQDRLWRSQNDRLQDDYARAVGDRNRGVLNTYMYNDDSFLINQNLRNGGDPDDVTQALIDVFSKYRLSESTITYRSVWDMDLPSNMVGSVWHDKGFQSTTFDKARAQNWAATRGDNVTLFEIVSPKGTRVALDPGQSELALQAGSSIRIVEDTTEEFAGRTIRVLRGYVEQ